MKLFKASKMHNILQLVFFALCFIGLNSSCETCWDCSFQTTIVTPTDSTEQTITSQTCQNTEKQNFEAQGYSCKMQ